jgi:hypothetical protein
MARCFPEFQHNYNQVSREVMYNWLNKHLKLGAEEPVVERPFKPVPPKELSVYDSDHPRPKDEVDAVKLRQYLTESSDKQMAALLPKDAKGLDEYRKVVGTALGVMIHDRFPSARALVSKPMGSDKQDDGVTWDRCLLGREDEGDQVPAVVVHGKKTNGTVVVWVHPDGKNSLLQGGKLSAAAQDVIDSGAIIVAVDVLLTGETASAKAMPVDEKFAGFTFGYNRPLLANRVHDIVTAVAFAKAWKNRKNVLLVGFERAGPWVVLARALCGADVARTVADLDGFRFEKVTAGKDEMMLPGALKYGGLPGFAALIAPHELVAHNTAGCGLLEVLPAAYKAAGAEKLLQLHADKMEPRKAVALLMGKSPD